MNNCVMIVALALEQVPCSRRARLLWRQLAAREGTLLWRPRSRNSCRASEARCDAGRPGGEGADARSGKVCQGGQENTKRAQFDRLRGQAEAAKPSFSQCAGAEVAYRLPHASSCIKFSITC